MTVRHETTSIAALSIILKNEFNKETTLFFALSIEFLSEIFAAPSLKKCHLRQCSAAATSPCFTRHFLVRSNQDTNWAGIHIDAKNNSQRSKKTPFPQWKDQGYAPMWHSMRWHCRYHRSWRARCRTPGLLTMGKTRNVGKIQQNELKLSKLHFLYYITNRFKTNSLIRDAARNLSAESIQVYYRGYFLIPCFAFFIMRKYVWAHRRRN